MTPVRIALISATPLAIAPATAAIAGSFPEVTLWNLLDDRLLADAEGAGGVTPTLAGRMDHLIELALGGGADGVLLTCSLFGTRADVRDPGADGAPVLSADGPLFEEVATRRPARLLLVASLESAARDSAARLAEVLESRGGQTTIQALAVPAAKGVATEEALVAALTSAVTAVEEPFDLIVLAQYSLSAAAHPLEERFGVPVLDGPNAAARRLAATIDQDAR